MPKTMPMKLQVEEIAFGRVFRLLSQMPGVVSINIDADSPANGRKERAKGTDAAGTSSICLILRAVREEPLSRKALERALEDGGKKAVTLNGALHKASAVQKLVKRNMSGLYAITSKGKKHLAEECGG